MGRSQFADVAEAFIDRLRYCGLRPITLSPENAKTDGFCAKVAYWRRDRPRVSVWYDYFLGSDAPQFWVGFQSSQGQIGKLVAELPQEYRRATRITDGDLREDSDRLTSQAVRRIRQCDGLAFETYADYDHFFGRYYLAETVDLDQLPAMAANFIGNIIQTVDPDLGIDVDLAELKKRQDISKTERTQLIKARRGQGQFRWQVAELWDWRCAVTGSSVEEVLRASHMKPWKISDDRERLDPNNGLLLIATLDALFDRGLISFSDNGEMLHSNRLPDHQKSLLLDARFGRLRKPPGAGQTAYLECHREHIWQGGSGDG